MKGDPDCPKCRGGGSKWLKVLDRYEWNLCECVRKEKDGSRERAADRRPQG